MAIAESNGQFFISHLGECRDPGPRPEGLKRLGSGLRGNEPARSGTISNHTKLLATSMGKKMPGSHLARPLGGKGVLKFLLSSYASTIGHNISK
jgi:hypothetical protein